MAVKNVIHMLLKMTSSALYADFNPEDLET
jgi:hypothetical protein